MNNRDYFFKRIDFIVNRVWGSSRLRVLSKKMNILVVNNFLFFFFFFISWRLITLQYCSGFCHTLKWISHGFTCVPYPDPLSHLPLHPIPLGHPSAPSPSTCLMHPTWAGDLFHPDNIHVSMLFSWNIPWKSSFWRQDESPSLSANVYA